MKVKNLVFSGAMASILMMGAAVAEDTVTTTDVTFGGKYNNNTLNVADDVSAIDFNYKGTNADGTPTTDISTSTTGTAENISKSNFAYTLADGTETDLDETSTEWKKSEYKADTVAGTNEGGNDYSKVHVAEGYGLNANTDVVDSSYSYENPQYDPDVEGSEQYITLNKDGSARTLKTTYSTNETYTSGSVELSSETTPADLISAYSYQTTDEAGNPTSHKYVLSDSGLGVKDLNNDGQGVNLDDPAIDPTLKTALEGMLRAYAEDSGTNLTDATSALADLQVQENNNFTAAKNAYTADNTKQGQLVANYDTYTKATTALGVAEGIDVTKSGEYNTANGLLKAARDVYNAPITDTIDTRANDAIVASLAEGGAINTAVSTGIKGLVDTTVENMKVDQLGWDMSASPDEDGSFAKTVKTESKTVVGAINENKDAIDTINNSDVMKSGITAAKVAQIETNKDAIDTINNSDVMKSGITAAKVSTYDNYADLISANTLAISGEAAERAAEDAKLRSAIDSNRNDIAALDSKVSDLDENLSAGIASSVALSAVEVSNVKKGEMSVGGGYGNYNSKSAMALGAAMGISDNWSANAGVGFGFGKGTKASFRIGTNYKFKLF